MKNPGCFYLQDLRNISLLFERAAYNFTEMLLGESRTDKLLDSSRHRRDSLEE